MPKMKNIQEKKWISAKFPTEISKLLSDIIGIFNLESWIILVLEDYL